MTTTNAPKTLLLSYFLAACSGPPEVKEMRWCEVDAATRKLRADFTVECTKTNKVWHCTDEAVGLFPANDCSFRRVVKVHGKWTPCEHTATQLRSTKSV